ncbi:MAG: hypothetical protein CL489_10705 [Acidobacteria bacterium]|nr:hypothetical protein [Acidobacteriota bacterium]|tara:strand:+ start:5269 stop:5454 length:186 start_codon:yes stop_codon:yes gene_type:complete
MAQADMGQTDTTYSTAILKGDVYLFNLYLGVEEFDGGTLQDGGTPQKFIRIIFKPLFHNLH